LEEKKIILVYKRNAVLSAVKTKKKRIKSRIILKEATGKLSVN